MALFFIRLGRGTSFACDIEGPRLVITVVHSEPAADSAIEGGGTACVRGGWVTRRALAVWSIPCGQSSGMLKVGKKEDSRWLMSGSGRGR